MSNWYHVSVVLMRLYFFYCNMLHNHKHPIKVFTTILLRHLLKSISPYLIQCHIILFLISNIINYYFPSLREGVRQMFVLWTACSYIASCLRWLLDVSVGVVVTNEPEFITCSRTRQIHKFNAKHFYCDWMEWLHERAMLYVLSRFWYHVACNWI